MRSLTVLGSCGAWPEPGRACAGFLLEYDGYKIVLDLGYAALPQLLKHCPAGALMRCSSRSSILTTAWT